MSDEAIPPQEDPVETGNDHGGRGILPLIKAAAFVSFVVLVEVVAAAVLAPSAQETERLAQQFVAASEGRSGLSTDEDGQDSPEAFKNVREVELGIYNITRYNPTTNTTMAIDFELYGAVLADDVAEFQRLFDNSQARVREQVIMSLHAAGSTDLTDPGLGLIKRRILEKTNRALGQPLVRDVMFTKFNFVER